MTCLNLSVPLKSVTSGLDAGVLTVLARTATQLTGRGVAALSGGSHAGVQPILERLTRQGLVLAQPVGNSVLYTLNRDHLLAGPLLALTESRTAFLDRLRSHVQSWRIAPVHASLFGSVARGDGDENSDIDVLVVRPRPVALRMQHGIRSWPKPRSLCIGGPATHCRGSRRQRTACPTRWHVGSRSWTPGSATRFISPGLS